MTELEVRTAAERYHELRIHGRSVKEAMAASFPDAAAETPERSENGTMSEHPAIADEHIARLEARIDALVEEVEQLRATSGAGGYFYLSESPGVAVPWQHIALWLNEAGHEVMVQPGFARSRPVLDEAAEKRLRYEFDHDPALGIFLSRFVKAGPDKATEAWRPVSESLVAAVRRALEAERTEPE